MGLHELTATIEPVLGRDGQWYFRLVAKYPVSDPLPPPEDNDEYRSPWQRFCLWVKTQLKEPPECVVVPSLCALMDRAEGIESHRVTGRYSITARVGSGFKHEVVEQHVASVLTQRGVTTQVLPTSIERI